MASSSSSLSPLKVRITKEQFYSFHNIDRKLFTRLTLHLGRDPGESAQVMAFWMWLEHGGKVTHFIHKALNTLPNTLLHIMADESCMVLNVIQNDEFPMVLESDIIPHDIPILQGMTKSGVSLRFFHKNRLSIIRGLTLFFNDVCLRAFEDLYITAAHCQNKTIDPISTGIGLHPEPQNYVRRMVLVNKYYNPFLVGAATFDAPMETIEPLPPHPMDGAVVNSNSSVDPLIWDPRVEAKAVFVGSAQSPSENLRHGFVDPYDLSAQRDFLNNEMADMLSRLHLHDDDGDGGDIGGGVRGDQVEEAVSADDRTIFLTFSKGYPISEKEVREFFTRKYGEFFDAIHMQEVQAEDHQPLYARLVVRSASFIPVVLEGQSKAKFSINGKHVWARMYVKKNVIGEQSSPKGVLAT
ncbi:hypothetical protein ABKV19_004345 [Rosa sericea]